MRIIKYNGFKYKSNYSLLFDNILISIFETIPVGEYNIELNLNFDEYINLTYSNGEIFTKDFRIN